MDQDTGPIEGTRDLLPSDLARSSRVRHLLQDFLKSHGYSPVDLPLMERTGLYLRKLGSRVAGSMFNLTDLRGERLSLRPELTASAIRAFMQRQNDLPLPVRWQYCGPVFRDGDAGNRLRQFTQLGAELIGAGTRRADAELLAVACAGLQAAGLARPHLVLGHAGLIPSLLEQMPLSERARMYLIGHLDLLRKGNEGLADLRRGLAERQPASSGETAPPYDWGDSDEAVNLVGWLLSEGATRPTGRRSTDQIVRRFRDKLHTSDDAAQLDQSLSLLGRLAAVRATPADALELGRSIVSAYGLRPGPLSDLEEIVSLLAAYNAAGVDIEVDLGLTRALGYYTGIVFEVYADGATPIAGGGRYDGLVRALGGAEDVPALGFAYTLEELEAALPAPNERPAAPTVLVVPESDALVGKAVQHMEALRARGEVCVLEVVDRSDDDRLRYCVASGVARVVLVGAAGIRDVRVGGEKAYAPAGAS